MMCLDSKIYWNKSFFNVHDSSLGRHVNETWRKSLEIQAYRKTKNLFEAKYGMKISFQLL